jgi:hypothetical protein
VFRSRTAALAVSAILGLAVAAPVAASADSSSQPAPTVSQSASAFTVNLPGVGSLTFVVDAATGAVSQVVATADPGSAFAAGTPKVTDEGVEVVFTDASGTATVLQAEVESEEGTVTVKPEAETSDEHPGANPAAPGLTEDEATETTRDDEAAEGRATMGEDNDQGQNEDQQQAGQENEGQDDQKAAASTSSSSDTTGTSDTSDNRGDDDSDGAQHTTSGPTTVAGDASGSGNTSPSSSSSTGTSSTSGSSEDGGSGQDGGSASHDGGGSGGSGSGD